MFINSLNRKANIMTTSNPTHTYAIGEMTKFIKAELKSAQKAFEKNPTSSNWTLVTDRMLAHQQLVQMVKFSKINATYASKIDALWLQPMGAWGEGIVNFMLNNA